MRLVLIVFERQTHCCIDLDTACRLCGMREDDVAAARARGRSVRAREAIVAVENGEWRVNEETLQYNSLQPTVKLKKTVRISTLTRI